MLSKMDRATCSNEKRSNVTSSKKITLKEAMLYEKGQLQYMVQGNKFELYKLEWKKANCNIIKWFSVE